MSEDYRRQQVVSGDAAIEAVKRVVTPTIDQVNGLVHTLEILAADIMRDYEEEFTALDVSKVSLEDWGWQHKENITLWDGTHESLVHGPEQGELKLSPEAQSTLEFLALLGDIGITHENTPQVEEIAQTALAWTIEQWTNATSQ